MNLGKFYTDKIYEEFHAVKKPYDFIVDLAEDNEKLILRVYEADWYRFSDKQHKIMVQYLSELQRIAHRHGVRCVVIGVREPDVMTKS